MAEGLKTMEPGSRAASSPAVEWLVTLILALLIALASLAILEVTSRLVHKGERPLLPIRRLAGTYPAMYPNSAMTAAVPDAPGVQYITNGYGARVGSAEAARSTQAPDVLVLGDSQALGWGLPFEATVGARMAQALTGTPLKAHLLAAPSIDPETALRSLRTAAAQWSSAPRVLVIYVNFGNDLDEVYIARSSHHFSNMRRINEWLGAWSFAALDLTKVSSAFDFSNRLGINEVLFQTSASERQMLSDAIAQTVNDASKVFGGRTRVVVVAIPNDYQFDAAEFSKYEITYTDKKLYEKYRSAVPAMKADMDEAYQRCLQEMRRLGHAVVDVQSFKSLDAERGSARQVYDRWSHHLSAQGNALAADAALRLLGDSGSVAAQQGASPK